MRQRNAAFHRGRVEVERVEHVVAGDRGDLDRRCDSRCAIATIASAAASGFAAPMLVTSRMLLALQDRQQRFDPLREPRVVAARRIVAPAQLRQRDRALGQAFENQIVERAVLREMHRRVEPVAGEAGAAAEPQRSSHGRVACAWG